MKECKLYQCEICNTQYKLKVDCLACEKNHVKPEGIKEYKYHAEKTYKNYPDTVYENNGGRCQSDKWISVDDAMPAEKNSIFAKFKGTDKWNSIMWEKTSDEVIVCIEFDDGTRKTTVAKTHDGIWKLDTKILKMKVTHWMPLPELPKEVLE